MSPKVSNLELIDRLLERKPISSYQGQLIYHIDDVHKFIDLMPRPTEEDKNPIYNAGAVTNEQELDVSLLEEFNKRPRKPFFKQGMGDKVLFIEQMDRFQDRQEAVKKIPSIEILRGDY